MAHFLRAKQAGIQNDLSAGIEDDTFVIDDLRRFGVASQVAELAYDPVQALLAVGTRSTQVGPGQIYVFGQKRISVTLPLPSRRASVKTLHFCSDRLLCLDDKNDLNIYSLPEKKLVASYTPPGTVTCIASDPTLDFVLLGMQSGEILAYDIDREAAAPFRLPCFWSEVNPKVRVVSIVALQLHPRDIGTLLIGYAEGAAIYSFKQNRPLKFFQYHVPRGAPGGDGDPASVSIARNPRLTHALWHPTGTFVLTGHEDSSMVFWDPKDGRVVMARNLTDTNIDRPSPGITTFASTSGSFNLKTPLLKIAWCAKQDPDDTGVLVAGGMLAMAATKGLTFLELGRTPNYATSSWQILSSHFESPKRQRILPTPPNVEVVNFCLIPRKTPWFAGAHDPIAIIAVLSSGELATLSFPSGFPISPTNQLHLSLSFVHPFVQSISQASVERNRWLGMTETRDSGPPFLRGGVEAPHPMRRFEDRSILQTAHADGTIRLWDAGHGDEIENDNLLQADVARALGRLDNLDVTRLSFSGASGELSAGLKSGEVVVFRWSRNNRPGQEPPAVTGNKARGLTNISDRKDPTLVEGFHPFTMLSQQNGPCTALKNSDIGFVAAAFAGGSIVVIDMRGPAVIFDTDTNEVLPKEHRSVLGHRSGSTSSCYVTHLEFSIMTVESEAYSSILLHAGTSAGHVATFKILPAQGGRYTVAYAGATTLDDEIVYIHPVSTSSGKPAYASQASAGRLRDGFKVDGALVVTSKTGARIFRPATDKGANRTWDGGAICMAAAVARCHELGRALVCLFSDGSARAFTLPGLRDIGHARLGNTLDTQRLAQACITSSGDILAWTGPSEMALLNVWGVGMVKHVSEDRLFNPSLLIPARPTISNFQWVSGTQYISPADVHILIGGANRPPSKRELAQSRADEAARRAGSRAAHQASAEAAAQEGWGAYLNRQVQQRTESLGIMGNSVDRLEGDSQSWSEDVSDFVSRQKKSLIKGVVKSSLGL